MALVDKIMAKQNKKSSIKFAEWLAQNHYIMVNETRENCFWKNEEGEKTTLELFEDFKNDDRQRIWYGSSR
jgi:hypothetical protein